MDLVVQISDSDSEGNVLIADMHAECENCEAAPATLDCTNCECAFCSSCSATIHASKAMKKHNLKPRTCENCEAAPATLDCTNCECAFCSSCSATIHASKAMKKHSLQPRASCRAAGLHLLAVPLTPWRAPRVERLTAARNPQLLALEAPEAPVALLALEAPAGPLMIESGNNVSKKRKHVDTDWSWLHDAMLEDDVEIVSRGLSRLLGTLMRPPDAPPSFCRTCQVKASKRKWPTAGMLIAAIEEHGEKVLSRVMLARSHMSVVWLVQTSSRKLVVKRFSKDLEQGEVAREVEANHGMHAARAQDGLDNHGGSMSHIFVQRGHTVGIATVKCHALSVVHPPSLGSTNGALNHSVADQMLQNGRPSARNLASVLGTLWADMQRLYRLGRFWNDGKAENVVFETDGQQTKAYCIDFGAASRKEDVLIDALVAFGSVMSGPQPPADGMDVLNAVPGLTSGFRLKRWLDFEIPRAAGDCWRALTNFEGTEEEARAHINTLGDKIESSLKHNDAFAFAMTALWYVMGRDFYEKVGGVYLGEIIANQARQPEGVGFSGWDQIPQPLLLSTDSGEACALPSQFYEFIAKRSSGANLQVEACPEELDQEVASLVKALLEVADA